MPILRKSLVVELVRNIKAFLNLEAGIVRGEIPASEALRPRREPDGNAAFPRKNPAPGQEEPSPQGQKVRRLRRRLAEKDREIASLRSRLATGRDAPSAAVKPENMVWMFGFGRTGSSWLSDMMADVRGHTRWNEPYVGELFGSAYYLRVGDRMRGRPDYILGDPYEAARARSIRNFILDGADVRFPDLATGGSYLVVKEPNGSIGAPLILKALPESRVILLVRDPRDVVSSALAANRKGSWGSQWQADGAGASLADSDPDGFVRQWSSGYLVTMARSEEAYEAHYGPKVLVRYEDLRSDALGTLRRIYSGLGISVDEEDLTRVVEKHDWDNVPQSEKGENKPRRKATPGGWKQDLTPDQARLVEQTTAPILDRYYPGWANGANTDDGSD